MHHISFGVKIQCILSQILVKYCKDKGIHRHLYTSQDIFGNPLPAKWIFSDEAIETVNRKMEMLRGVGAGLKNPIIQGGGEYSHDKIQFATKYARQVIDPNTMGDPRVTKNILDLFDFITKLTESEFLENELDGLLDSLYDLLSDHEGLLPISEATYTLHELVHVTSQIRECGPVRL